MPVTQITTVDWLKTNYLFGIDLTDDDGNAFPDSLFQTAIDQAVSLCEQEFDVVMRRNRRVKYRERYDGTDWMGDSWYLITLDKRPLSRVTDLKLRFGSFDPTSLPSSWVQIASREAAQIQLVPGPEGFKGFSFIANGLPLLGTDMLVGRKYVPGWFEIEYEAGFEFKLDGTASVAPGASTVTLTPGTDDDGNTVQPEAVNELEVGMFVTFGSDRSRVYRVADVIDDTTFEISSTTPAPISGESVTVLNYNPSLLDFIGLAASMLPLDTAGDLIIGAGISGQHISLDGLSQSIQTTSGVENSGYGARMRSYQSRLRETVKFLKRHYRPHNMLIL